MRLERREWAAEEGYHEGAERARPPPTQNIEVRIVLFEYLCLCGLEFDELIGEIYWGDRDVTGVKRWD